MSTDFSSLNLCRELVQTLADLGYLTPTPIQSAIIPEMHEGIDVVGQAQTGTGKTAAFSLPIIQKINQGKKHVQGLVLAPTRELAMQVTKAMEDFARGRRVNVLSVYGGQSYSLQIGRLKKGVDIVVGTPGRMLDLITKGCLDLSRVSTVVLDEADEMLSMGFREDIEEILKKTPVDRQTALFSATMPKPIRHLANKYMNKPKFCCITPKQLTVDAIEQHHCLVNEQDRPAAISRLFEMEEIARSIIFVRTRIGTGELANALTMRGFSAEALNGDLSQDSRERVLARFRNDQIKVLVATDVAARGLDIDDISHIINYDLPRDPEVYVHRIGRTGRAGKSGVAISLVTPAEKWRLRKIEGFTRQRIPRLDLPSEKDIKKHRENALIEKVVVWLKRGRCRRELEIAERLVSEGYDMAEIAAVALKLARSEEKQRPIEPISEVMEFAPKKKGRERNDRKRRRSKKDKSHNFHKNSHEEGMVRLSLSTGKISGISANNVVGTLARYADIPGHRIGRIQIDKQRTFVDVPEKFVGQVLANTRSYKIGRRNVTVQLA